MAQRKNLVATSIATLVLAQLSGELRAAGPTTELYLTTKPLGIGTSTIAVVRGSSVNRSWTTVNEDELALAVRSTVRTLGLHNEPAPGDAGSEYTTLGVPTGVSYPMPFVSPPAVQFLDGASDGVFNYAFDFARNTAYRFNSDWTNPQALFRINESIGRMGITYDASNHSLWLSGFGNGIIENRSMDGTLLDSFQVAHSVNTGLALNPADGTLWLLSVKRPGTIEQFSRTGSFFRVPINRQTYSSLESRRLFGAEFAVAPLRWKLDGNGDWSAGQNWDGPVPSGAGSIANLTSAITEPRTITLNAARTVGRLNIDNDNSYTVAGAGTLTLSAGAGTAQVNIGSGSHVLAVPVVLASDTNFKTLRAQSALDAAAGIAGGNTITLTKSGLGLLRTTSLQVGSVNVVAGTLQVLPPALRGDWSGTSVVRALGIAAGAAMDLTSNALIVDYTAPSPIATVRGYLFDGRLHASTSAPGVGLGLAEASALGLSSFAGQIVDTTSLLIASTYLGDSNLDGQVDITDLAALATAWQTSGDWINGDFDYSGFVDITDLAMLATNWQAGVGSAPGTNFEQALTSVGLGGISVPEPRAVMLLCGFAGVIRRRRPNFR